ncbi:hypothetical protein, partial [Escherichia coli]|uniref:hypothetical protein n=1 Tax=Escherichia coli TaxID=562 RepID=UPI001980B3DE
ILISPRLHPRNSLQIIHLQMGVPALFSTDSLLTPEEGATAGLASSRQISLNNPHKQKTRYVLSIGVT